jgi:hypothetical protein
LLTVTLAFSIVPVLEAVKWMARREGSEIFTRTNEPFRGLAPQLHSAGFSWIIAERATVSMTRSLGSELDARGRETASVESPMARHLAPRWLAPAGSVKSRLAFAML